MSLVARTSARALALLFICAPGALLAQDAMQTADAPAGDDLKIIRETLDQQSKQIDVLAQEIARLNLLLEARTPTAQGLAPSPAADAAAPSTASTAGATAPKAIQGMQVMAATPVTPSAPSTSQAAGPVHIVAKGETLTAIARHYKVTVPDLLKVNKISDVRKLQIGQSLTLPPGAKLQESPSPAPQQ
jgi:LysM repeat protein